MRQIEQRPDLSYFLIGHSAGAQFLARAAPFAPTEAKRIILANPSAYVAPTRSEKFPYGFGGAPAALGDDAALRRYLALPITIFVGGSDTGSRQLDVSAEANVQGPNRRERGRFVFQQAETLAAAHGWQLNWRFVEAPGVGHNSTRMFTSSVVDEAFR
jgi:pimeloyl-ACP methyl ester carboxylesterase